MSGKAILILLVIAGVLGGVLWFTDETPPVKEIDENAVLEGRSLVDARKIRWQFKDLAAIEIGPGPDGRMHLKEPIQDLASVAYLQPIVHSWDTAMMRAVPIEDTAEGRAKAGLEAPELTMIVEWEEGDKRLEIEVGAVGPLGSTRFLRVHDKIWEGGNSLLETMKVGLDDLRDRQVFRHSYTNTTELRVEQVNGAGEREALRLQRKGDDWLLVEPIEGRADPVAAQRFVTAVTSLKVDHFQPGTMPNPEGEPDIEVSIKGAFGDEECSLWLQKGQIYGRLPGRGHIFTSSNNQFSQIFVNAVDNLRARILVPMGDSTFENLVELIVDPGQNRGDRVRMVRESQNKPWRLLEPVDYAAKATPVNESAHALHRLVARAFVTADGVRPRANDPRYGMTEGRWAVTTRRVNTKKFETLWFGGDAGVAKVENIEQAMVYCCREDEPDNIAIVPKQALEVLQRAWAVYCDKLIMKQPAIIEQVVLSHQDGRTRTFRMTPDGWILEGIEGDRSEVGDFAADVLSEFYGKTTVDMRKGYGDPDWLLQIKRGTGDELGLVKIWDPGEGKPLIAKSRSEQPIGFALSKLDSKSLRAMWQ